MGLNLGKGSQLKSVVGAEAESATPSPSGSRTLAITQTTDSASQSAGLANDISGATAQTPAATVQAATLTVTPPPGAVTVAQLIADDGGAGEIRTIIDPTYPNANGGVTWIAGEPLAGVDPGGKARHWARYPAGSSGGYWRRNDWNGLTPAGNIAGSIKVDWCAVDEDEDITTIVQELHDQYVQGAEGNLLSFKWPERNSFVCGRITATGDGTASAIYRFAPLTVHAVRKSPAYQYGSEDLMLKTWTNFGTNKWSTTLGENLKDIWFQDPNNLPTNYTANAGPFFPAFQNTPGSNLDNIFSVGDAAFSGSTLAVYCPQDPSTYFEDMIYTTGGDLDLFEEYTDIYTLYAEGGADLFDGTTKGIRREGRKPNTPLQGRYSASGSTAATRIIVTTGFTEAGSDMQWYDGISGTHGAPFDFDKPGAHLRYAKVTLGGRYENGFVATNGGMGDWVHGDDGTLGGVPFEIFVPWGTRTWTTQVHGTGADEHNSLSFSQFKSSTLNWGPADFLVNAHYSRDYVLQYKQTGYWKGPSNWTFYGGIDDEGTTFTLGSSTEDRCIFELGYGFLAGVFPADTTKCHNGRPIVVEESGGLPYNKTDSIQVQRENPGYMQIIVGGDKHPISGEWLSVDYDAGNLNQSLNPAVFARDIGLYVNECTNSFWTGNTDVDLLVTGPGQGVISLSTSDYRQVAQNYTGRWFMSGDGTSAYFSFHNVPPLCTFDDFKFETRPDGTNDAPFRHRRIWLNYDGGGDTNWGYRPNDVTINNCTFENKEQIYIGNGSGRGLPPLETNITNCTFNGASRDVILINPHSPSNEQYNQGYPVIVNIDAATLAAMATGQVIQVDQGKSNANTYIKIAGDANYYGTYTVGGPNTPKASGPPPVKAINASWRDVQTGSQNSSRVFMPAFVQDGETVVTALVHSGDPGAFTEISSFTNIGGSVTQNLSAGDLYLTVFWRNFPTGTDAWDTGAGDAQRSHTFTWTNNVILMGLSHSFRGMHVTAPIGSGSQSTAQNSSVVTATAPTITTDVNDSMLIHFFAFPGDVTASGFTDGAGGNIMNFSDEVGLAFGRHHANVSGICALQQAGTAGSHTGASAILNSSSRYISTTIELKPA